MITKQIINFNLNIIMMFALLFSALLVASFNNISNQRLFLRHLTVCWSIHICCKEALKGLGVGFDSSNHPEVWKLIQSFYIFHFLKKKRKSPWKFHVDNPSLTSLLFLILYLNGKIEGKKSMSNILEKYKNLFLQR